MIDAGRVTEILLDCLYKNDEISNDGTAIIPPVTAKGIIRSFGFHPDRLQKHKKEIESIIKELPDRLSNGISFLEMCMTKDGYQWGEQKNCEDLLVLGIAIKRMDYCVPRSVWPVLPGGMPCIIMKGDEPDGQGQEHQEGNKEEA